MIKRLLDALKNRLRIVLRYWRPWGYNAASYWHDRHRQYGFNLQGVGEKGLSAEQNQQVYDAAQNVYLKTCNAAGINLESSSVLDVGCGNGFYTQLLCDEGTHSYTGIDIADTLFDELRTRFPEFTFLQIDVTSQSLPGSYDLIQMIDVTQHITSNSKFDSAMKNLSASLNPGGVIILTSWLQANLKHSFYEKSRTLAQYQAAFPGFSFSEPVPFRDKYIFTLTQTDRN